MHRASRKVWWLSRVGILTCWAFLALWAWRCDGPTGGEKTPEVVQDGPSSEKDVGEQTGPELLERLVERSDERTDAGESTPEDPPQETVEPDQPKPFGLTQREPNTTCKLEGTPGGLSDLKAVETMGGLEPWNRLLYMTYPNDQTDRLFFLQQDGEIYVSQKTAAGTYNSKSVFLDLRSKASRRGNEEGLLGLAFHPNYKQNRYFYVYYSAYRANRAGTPRYSVVARFEADANDPNKADPQSEQIIMEVDQPYGNHNGGMMAFGPDGYLYISLGDGGSGGDPLNSGQDTKTLLGSILRIDVDRKDAGLEYAVPPDNPFVGRNDGSRGEIWAYGLRNVWRFSFDRLTGTLWAGDVGQRAREEISIIVKGGNYGWKIMEGDICYSPRTNCDQTGLILPVIDHNRTDARSITGGYVYRGQLMPSMRGAYIYGDYVTGKVFALRYDGEKVTESKLLLEVPGIASFAEDQDGELYILSFSGKIFQLTEDQMPAPSTFPTRLSETGCFSSLAPLQPAAGLVPYGLNWPFWSDRMQKDRYMALPGTEKITFTEDGAWDFPDKTVIIKHFSIPASQAVDGKQRNVETRFMVKQGGEWRGYTYVWNEAQTDAVLLDSNATRQLSIKDPADPNQTLSFTYEIPSRTECLQCHTTQAGSVLGLRTRQINGNFTYGAVTDNQLRALNHIEMFTQALAKAPTDYARFPTPGDPNATDAEKARVYLDVNCATCHRPGVLQTADFDLRFDTPLGMTDVCNVDATRDPLGLQDPKRLVPGDPEKSAVFLRMRDRDGNRMPQIGAVLPDTQGIALIRRWIQGLQDCQGK